jgi:hypothetical protein
VGILRKNKKLTKVFRLIKPSDCVGCTRMECMFNSVSHMPCKTRWPWALANLTQNKIVVEAWQLRHMSVE